MFKIKKMIYSVKLKYKKRDPIITIIYYIYMKGKYIKTDFIIVPAISKHCLEFTYPAHINLEYHLTIHNNFKIEALIAWKSNITREGKQNTVIIHKN